MITLSIIHQAICYIANDPFFWPAMAFTTMVSIFVGSVIYDGNLKEVKKAILVMISYMVLLLMVNLTRTIPEVEISVNQYKPISSAVTTVIITLFYFLGMFIGVTITKVVHREKHDLRRVN